MKEHKVLKFEIYLKIDINIFIIILILGELKMEKNYARISLF